MAIARERHIDKSIRFKNHNEVKVESRNRVCQHVAPRMDELRNRENLRGGGGYQHTTVHKKDYGIQITVAALSARRSRYSLHKPPLAHYTTATLFAVER